MEEVAEEPSMKEVFKLDATDSCGDNTLHLAAQNGDMAMVQLLLERKADVDAKEKYNVRTALHLAARYGHKAVAQLLLEYKADVEAKDSDEWTAVHMEAQKWATAVRRLLQEPNLDVNEQAALDLVVRNGCNANMRGLD